MLSLWEDGHLSVAVETQIPQERRSSYSTVLQKRATSVNRQGDLRVTAGVNCRPPILLARHKLWNFWVNVPVHLMGTGCFIRCSSG